MRWQRLGVIVTVTIGLVSYQAGAQQVVTQCGRDYFGKIHCTSVQQGPRIDLGRIQMADPNILYNPQQQQTVYDAAGAGMRGAAEQRARFEVQKRRDEEKMVAALRDILANPESAELTARAYGVQISPETQARINAMRADTVSQIAPSSPHRLRVERRQKALLQIRSKIASASQTCQDRFERGKIKTLEAKTECSRKLVMPTVKAQGVKLVDIYENTYSKVKALSRKVDQGTMTEEEMAREAAVIDQAMSERVLARFQEQEKSHAVR